jgi:hypothetical protein
MNNILTLEKFINDFLFTPLHNKSGYNKQTKNTDFVENNIQLLKTYISKELNANINRYNYKIYDNVVSNNLCDYIINESEKYAASTANKLNPTGWTTRRHANYPTTDLPVNSIPSLSILVNNVIKYDIMPRVAELYNVNKYLLDCNDIFVVKYDAKYQSELEKHKDGSIFSFNLLLNHESEFEGGGTIFYHSEADAQAEAENETIVKNSKGGLLIHSGQVLHAGNKITKGKRYLLVGFINYLKNMNKLSTSSQSGIIYDLQDKSNVNFNSWQLTVKPDITKLLVDHITNATNKLPTQLLDTLKTEFTIVEKVVFEMAMFHLNRLNIQYDPKRYFIEFWWKNENAIKKLQTNKINEIHCFHSDKDEHLYKNTKQLIHPFLATVTYLNDSIFPTIITSSPEKNFNEKKQVVLDKGITLSFPKKMKHICFSPENIHGVYNVFSNINKNTDVNTSNRITLMFNIWDNYTPNCNPPNTLDTANTPNTMFTQDTTLCELSQEPTNKLTINLKEHEMCELVKRMLKKDTTVVNNYVTMETINTHDSIEFDLLVT